MYDLPCNDALEEQKVSLESLAMIYVTADKYQVQSLQEKLHHKIQGHRTCKHLTDVEGFLDALEIIITATTLQDKWARATMINACVKHIQTLQQSPDFSALLRRHGDIGAEIIHHDRLPLMLEGSWYCGIKHSEAVPTCRKCRIAYPESYVRSHRHLKTWKCPNCPNKERPVCFDCGGEGRCSYVKWKWRDESE
jgi:hypothetical protein